MKCVSFFIFVVIISEVYWSYFYLMVVINRMAQEHKKNGSRLFQKYTESALESLETFDFNPV